MAGLPAVADDSGGATPDVPASATTCGSPRHAGEVDVGVPELVALRLRVALGVSLVGLAPNGDGVPVTLDVPLRLAVALGNAGPQGLLEPAGVGGREHVALGAAVGVAVGVAVNVAAWVALGELLPPDGLRRLATSRPRSVSRATTSSGVSPLTPPLPPPPLPPPLLPPLPPPLLPTPPAASHSSANSRMPLT